jgi:hypothetical protein
MKPRDQSQLHTHLRTYKQIKLEGALGPEGGPNLVDRLTPFKKPWANFSRTGYLIANWVK